MTENTRSAVADETEVGGYFVANYPPFSVWTRDGVRHDAIPAQQTPPVPGTPLGLYLHIPFCRKRCHFCYFRVYTGKNAEEVNSYLDLLAREVGTLRAASRDRRPQARFRLFRRRHAVVLVDHAARRTGRSGSRR